MPHHLRPVPTGGPEDPETPEGLGPFEAPDELGPLARPAWWRWVAVAVIAALVLTGPLAWVLYRLLT